MVSKARAKVNKEVGRFMKKNGGIEVRHKELEQALREFFLEDGVHLNPIGTNMWFLGLQEGLDTALQGWRDGRQ